MNKNNIIEFLKNNQKKTIFNALDIFIACGENENFNVYIDVEDKHKQHFGWVHGGVFVLLAESAASIASLFEIDIGKYEAICIEINANHLSATTGGRIFAFPKIIFKGRSIFVFEVKITDKEDKMICLSRCTMKIRRRKP